MLHGHQLFLSPINLLALVQFSSAAEFILPSPIPSSAADGTVLPSENWPCRTADYAIECSQPERSDVTTVAVVNIINQGHLNGERCLLN